MNSNSLFISLLALVMVLLLFRRDLFSLFLLSLLNSLIVTLMLFSLSFTWYSFTFFLVFVGGLLVVFLYLVSLDSKTLNPWNGFSVLLVCLLFSCVSYFLFEPKSNNNNEYLVNCVDPLISVLGLLLVVFVMLIVNFILSNNVNSIRRFY